MYSSIYCTFLVSKALQVLYFSKKSHCEIKLSSKRTNNQEIILYNYNFHEAKGLRFYKCYSKDKKTLVFKSAFQKESQTFGSLYAANKQALGRITYPLISTQKIIQISMKYINKIILL